MKIIGLISKNRDLPAFKIQNKIIKSGVVDAGDKDKLYRHISQLRGINPDVLAEFEKEEKEYER